MKDCLVHTCFADFDNEMQLPRITFSCQQGSHSEATFLWLEDFEQLILLSIKANKDNWSSLLSSYQQDTECTFLESTVWQLLDSELLLFNLTNISTLPHYELQKAQEQVVNLNKLVIAKLKAFNDGKISIRLDFVYDY